MLKAVIGETEVPPDKIEFRKLLVQWQQGVLGPFHEELAKRLSSEELSALHSCIPDCFESFRTIYKVQLPILFKAIKTNDHATILECVHGIGGVVGGLEHVKAHIVDARKGFDELLKLLDELSGKRFQKNRNVRKKNGTRSR